LQTSDLLLRDTVAWYETEHPPPDSAAVQQLAARAAGLPQVRFVSIFDSHGGMRFRSRDMLPRRSMSPIGRISPRSGTIRTWARFSAIP
jgi:hypothetical protein